MDADQTKPDYADRRRLIRVVNRRNLTVQCKACGTTWRPEVNENGRVVRWGLRCPNKGCKYHKS